MAKIMKSTKTGCPIFATVVRSTNRFPPQE
jgi:hypothetical protein